MRRARRAGRRVPERPIEGDWPYLWFDATYVKTREAEGIVSVAVIVAVGVDTVRCGSLKFRVSQPFRGVDLHHAMGHDRKGTT